MAQNGTVPFRVSDNLRACCTVLARRVSRLNRLLGQPEAFAAERDAVVAALRGLPVPDAPGRDPRPEHARHDSQKAQEWSARHGR